MTTLNSYRLSGALIKRDFGEAEKNFAALSGATQHLPPATLFLSKDDLLDSVNSLSWVSVLASVEKKTKAQVFVKQSPQPAFNRKFDRLIAYLNENHEKGYQNYICCASAEQAQRLNAIFEEMDQTVHYKTVVQPLFEGFEDIEAKLAIFTDHQIFERYHKFHLKNLSYSHLVFLKFHMEKNPY